MILWGSTLCFILIILLILMLWLVKYPDIIPSETVITTEIPPQKEYAKITGKLDTILVNDNDQVSINQPLAIIENTANYKDVFRLKTIIDTIKMNTKSFKFPFDSLPVLFLGNIDAQYALFENSYIQYKLNSELQPFSNDTNANRLSIKELNTRLKSLKSQKEISKTELEFKAKDLKRNKTLFDKGIISEEDYENKQLEYAQAKRNYANFDYAISQIKENINNAYKDSRNTQINKIKKEMTLLKNVIQSFNQLKKALKDRENKYVLKSNIKGKLSFLNYWNTHQTVNQGDSVFTIIPNESSAFIAKLKVPMKNSGKIKVG